MKEKVEFEKIDDDFYRLCIDGVSLYIETGKGLGHIADGLETFAEALRGACSSKIMSRAEPPQE